MKINTPVTDTEVDYPEEYNILSTTDLKAAFTYCNDDFIKVSGFSVDELAGRNHNIVRHPDMPPALYSPWSRRCGHLPPAVPQAVLLPGRSAPSAWVSPV